MLGSPVKSSPPVNPATPTKEAPGPLAAFGLEGNDPKSKQRRYVTIASAVVGLLLVVVVVKSGPRGDTNGAAAGAAGQASTALLGVSTVGSSGHTSLAAIESAGVNAKRGSPPVLKLPDLPGEKSAIFDMEVPPSFPLTERKAAGITGVATSTMRVPLYIIITNRQEDAVELARMSAHVDAIVQKNRTHETHVKIRMVFLDNTGCSRAVRVVKEEAHYFESHTEFVRGFNCRQWRESRAKMMKEIGAEVIVAPSPLPFGLAQNMVLQDAHDKRGAPRILIAHNDAGVQSVQVLERLAVTAALVTDPFCAILSSYDVIAAYDVFTVTRQVGEFDPYLWYHSDQDFFARCRHARLPMGEMGGTDIIHHGGGTTIGLSDKGRGRVEAQKEMFRSLHAIRMDQLKMGAPDLPPKGVLQLTVEFNDLAAAKSAAEIARVVSIVLGRWMMPWQYIIGQLDSAADVAATGHRRVPLTVQLIATDLKYSVLPREKKRVTDAVMRALKAARVEMSLTPL